MNLTPLLTASAVIQIHTALAVLAVLLTIAIFCIRRGSPAHRVLGWTWVVLMGGVALSSFWISQVRLIGPFSPIHLLSVFVLVQLVISVRAARSGRIGRHRGIMRAMVFGALIGAGAFTFFPGRTMYQVFLGG